MLLFCVVTCCAPKNGHLQGAFKLSEKVRQPFPTNTFLRFSREMGVATIGPFQMLRSLCVCNRHEFHDLVTLPTQVMA